MKSLYKILILITLVFSCQAQTNEKGESKNNKYSIDELQKASNTSRVNTFNQVEGTELVNFRYAASLILPAVVHVISTNKVKKTRDEQIPDFFRDFFGDRWFRDFNFDFNPQPSISGGSGVIITSDGYIVTNYHVVSTANEIEVTLYDRRSYKASIVGTDPSTDIALLKINEKDLAFLQLGNSDEVQIGDWVLAGGNPFNLSSTVTAGIISAKARNINILRDQQSIESFLQTDAALNPGNSGGALVNVRGELVGVNSAIATPTGSYAGYSFAIPVNIVKKVIDDLLNYGVVQRGFLGVTIRDMNSDLAKELEITSTTGVYVDSVVSGSAAESAGIKPKDVILSIDGKEVESSPQLQEIIGEHRPGDQLTLTLHRKNKLKTLKVTLKNKRGTTDVVVKEPEDILTVLGIQLDELTDSEKNKSSLSNGVKVVAIDDGLIKDNTEMRKGFVILKVNNDQVRGIDDFIHIMEGMRGGILIEGVYLSSPQTRYYYGFGM